jgi:hypothetical protein
MKPPMQTPTAERLIAGLLATFFALFGWFDLWQGGITLKGKSGAVRFVDGRAGLAVAAFAFVVAALGVAMLLRTFKVHRSAYYTAGVVLALPPILFLLLRH